jgi:hypothetical protein
MCQIDQLEEDPNLILNLEGKTQVLLNREEGIRFYKKSLQIRLPNLYAEANMKRYDTNVWNKIKPDNFIFIKGVSRECDDNKNFI